MFSPFVAWLWHLASHKDRLVCTDTFALRRRNRILECLTWWKEQETENAQTYCIQLKALLFIRTLFFKPAAYLSKTAVSISVKHTLWGKAMKPRYGKREWGLWHRVLPFHAQLHGTWALSDLDYHPSPAVPFHTGPHIPPTINFTATNHPIPFCSLL